MGKVGIKFSQIARLLAKGQWRPLCLSVVFWFSLHLNTAHTSLVCMFVCMYGPFICMYVCMYGGPFICIYVWSGTSGSAFICLGTANLTFLSSFGGGGGFLVCFLPH